ncbi:MAG: methyltransferase domain-containing protein [Candidatus Tectomicrobia bacterium]|uniref:Methyltransferase domain-containing protein n=1 Tax=Tectimicrobiota bacterium TaxID=2528274 RepID=A0A937W027_UNCTE|nr:methyltransferase domain-containing protein [Candidatus Tectomicrobia bacterium]
MRWAVLQKLWVPPRSHQPEWLDAEEIPADDLRGNLSDLRRLNRYLGSHWLLQRTLQRLWQTAGCPRSLRILDIGTGAGDIPAVLLRWGQRHGVQLRVVALDNHAGIIRYLRSSPLCPASLWYIQADGLCLPFQARTFDVVVCSTMLHHLTWQQGLTLLRNMAAVARYGVVLRDLVRHRLHYALARLLLPVLCRHPMTRHDGPLSVLRAYSVEEVRTMARLAGWVPACISLLLSYRFVLVYRPRIDEDPHGA